MRKMLSALALVVITFIAAPGLAQAAEPASVRVSYSDLDVASVEGADAVLARIERAARASCGDYGYARHNRRLRQAVRACAAATTQEIVAKLRLPTVTDAYRGRREETYAA